MSLETFKSGLRPLKSCWPPLNTRRRIVEGLFFVLLLASVEAAGRRTRGDIADLIILLGTLPILFMVGYAGRRGGFLLLSDLGRKLYPSWKRLRGQLAMQVGVDFRTDREGLGEGYLPYRDLHRALGVILLALVVVLPLAHRLPDGLGVLREGPLYIAHLAILTLFWSLMVGIGLLDLGIVVVLFYHYVLKSPFFNPLTTEGRRTFRQKVHLRRLGLFAALAASLALLEVFAHGPGWLWVLSMTFVFTAAASKVRRAGRPVGLLIRKIHQDRIFHTTIHEWNYLCFTVILGLSLVLFLASTGTPWISSGDEAAGVIAEGSDPDIPETVVNSNSHRTMICTYWLGRAFGMLTVLGTLFYLFAAIDFLEWRRLRFDPSRPLSRRLGFRRNSLPSGFEVFGWNLAPFDGPPPRDCCDLYHDPDAPENLKDRAPLFKRNLMDMVERDRTFQLDRADFIAKRRAFYRGLQGLVKIGRSHAFRQGAGFLLIPHVYFVEGLHRDDGTEQLDEGRIIGPGFHELWGHRVRHFLNDVFDGLDLDIIYYEEKLSFDQIRKVFEILFELHHLNATRLRAEMHHFQGIPGVRVLIETLRPESERRFSRPRGDYPEPSFTNLSRARVLLIFKDRGGPLDLLPDLTPGIGENIPAFF